RPAGGVAHERDTHLRHARPCAGHPRLLRNSARTAWMAGTSPAMTGLAKQPRTWLIPVVLLAAAIALPFAVPTYYVQFVSKAFIMGILAMALNLAVGHGGLVSLCHAAFFGLAGYVLALLSPGSDPA